MMAHYTTRLERLTTRNIKLKEIEEQPEREPRGTKTLGRSVEEA